MTGDISVLCVVCKGGDGGPPDKCFVTDPSLDMIVSIKDYARKRVEAGELDPEPLADYMASLFELQENDSP